MNRVKKLRDQAKFKPSQTRAVKRSDPGKTGLAAEEKEAEKKKADDQPSPSPPDGNPVSILQRIPKWRRDREARLMERQEPYKGPKRNGPTSQAEKESFATALLSKFGHERAARQSPADRKARWSPYPQKDINRDVAATLSEKLASLDLSNEEKTHAFFASYKKRISLPLDGLPNKDDPPKNEDKMRRYPANNTNGMRDFERSRVRRLRKYISSSSRPVQADPNPVPRDRTASPPVS